ncbi:MAG: hypothetical protein WBA99_05845 [Nodosilinea sp.]
MDQRASNYPVSSYYRPPKPGPGKPPRPPRQSQGTAPRSAQRSQQSSACVPPQAGGHPHPVPAPMGSGDAPRPQPKLLVAGGSVLALAALLITPRLNQDPVKKADPFTCIRQEQPQALVSRGQVKKLLDTDLKTPKATVQGLLSAPYCVLSPGKTEAGLPAEREAYPLEFDPQTWLVVLYDGDRYVGYDFRFR